MIFFRLKYNYTRWVTGEFPAQMAGSAENLSIWLRHHGFLSVWHLMDVKILIQKWRDIVQTYQETGWC